MAAINSLLYILLSSNLTADPSQSSVETLNQWQSSNYDGVPVRIICRRNEELSLCPSSCPDDCLNFQDPDRECPFHLCVPGCVCSEGFVRGPNGWCIKPEECPDRRRPNCTDLEFYSECGTACQVNCDNYEQKDKACDMHCVSGCFCAPGLIRGPNGNCIPYSECPQSEKPTEGPQFIAEEVISGPQYIAYEVEEIPHQFDLEYVWGES